MFFFFIKDLKKKILLIFIIIISIFLFVQNINFFSKEDTIEIKEIKKEELIAKETISSSMEQQENISTQSDVYVLPEEINGFNVVR